MSDDGVISLDLLDLEDDEEEDAASSHLSEESV